MTFPSFNVGDVLTAADMNAVGLWKVGTFTAAAGASEILCDSVFTNDFQNYEIHWIINPSADVNLLMQFRTGTSNNATTNYANQKTSFAASAVTTTRTTGATSYSPADIYSASDANSGKITVFRPKETARTTYIATAQTALTTVTQWQSTGQFAATTAFDGFRLFPSSGTITATVRVYGYRN